MLIDLHILEKIIIKTKNTGVIFYFLSRTKLLTPPILNNMSIFWSNKVSHQWHELSLSLYVLQIILSMFYRHSLEYNVQFLFPCAAPSWSAVLGHTGYGTLSRRSRSYTVILIFFLYSRITKGIKLSFIIFV